jgi:hypothetical protein
MSSPEMEWCKDFVESLNGRAPTAAEVFDFLDLYVKRVEDAIDDGYALGYDDAKRETALLALALDN